MLSRFFEKGFAGCCLYGGYFSSRLHALHGPYKVLIIRCTPKVDDLEAISRLPEDLHR